MTGTERLAELVDGKNPKLVLRLPSGFVVMADNQFLTGYCLLLAYPEVNHLTDLRERQRVMFLDDMALVGEAIMKVTECKRINYAMYGNVDPFLHAHVWPRFDWEVPEFATLPPLSIPEEIRTHSDTVWDPAVHGNLQDQLRRTLMQMLEERHNESHPHRFGH